MRKKVSLLVIVLLLTGCSSIGNKQTIENKNKTIYPVSTYITEEMKEQVGKSRTMAEVRSMELKNWAQESDNIVLATIVSIDGAKTVMQDGHKDELGYTFGKLLIQDVFQGAVKKGDYVSFIKEGGIISMAQMDAADDPEAVAKREYLRKKNGKKDYDPSKYFVNTTVEADIMLDAS